MTSLPPLDAHAHIAVDIAGSDMDALNAFVFAMTRSLEEASAGLRRSDQNAIWGIGCHPGLVTSLKHFDSGRFEQLLRETALVGELGLDASTRVDMELQKEVLSAALAVLSRHPRIVSLHSYGATDLLLEVLAAKPLRGVILHWWLGDEAATREAVKSGFYFSFNASSVRKKELLDQIPITRMLAETDHPYGDRWSAMPRMPGRVDQVEAGLGRHFGLDAMAVRRRLWRNFATLVSEIGCKPLLPQKVRSVLDSLDENAA